MPPQPQNAESESVLNKTKQINYWKRCLKTYLPEAYTSFDSNRMLLAYFSVSALDLLGSLTTCTTAQERNEYCQWIYSCQHPDGGFRGSPGAVKDVQDSEWDKAWYGASVASTFFALAGLLILGDDLNNVKRKECLQWLRRMQRPDGSFGESLSPDGKIEGGTDTRWGYCATGVRWMLRGNVTGEVDGVPDIEVEKLVKYIRGLETYDGGISEQPFHEAHAGYTYCAIAALSFLERLPLSDASASSSQSTITYGLTNLPLTLSWIVSRQTDIPDTDNPLDPQPEVSTAAPISHDSREFVKLRSYTSFAYQQSLYGTHYCAGFNGRCNKLPDTCYAFWACGSLHVLNQPSLISADAGRRYLLKKTQHLVGGFGKYSGDPPDIYHSYLGLAALAMMGEKEVKPICPALSFSLDARNHLETLSWRKKIVER